jgi:hypothetical protein
MLVEVGLNQLEKHFYYNLRAAKLTELLSATAIENNLIKCQGYSCLACNTVTISIRSVTR